MAEHLETVYGKSNLADELAKLGNYILVTMDAAWDLCEPFFRSSPPIEVVMVDSLDLDKLDAVYNRLSSSVLEAGVTVVGLGGGTALDAAKYFAYRENSIPLLVPSITSTNAPFTDFISIRKNGGSFGFKVDGYPKKIIVDYELIRLAEPRFNRAGYGDLLYMQTNLNDWKIMHSRNIGPAVDESIERDIVRIIDTTLQHAAEIGEITETGIRVLMENTQLSSELYMNNLSMPIGAGSEHLFAWNLELTTKKPLIHGEIVSLGIVISSFLQSAYLPDSRYRELRKALDEAQVVYHPDDIGVTWSDIEMTLVTVEAYNRQIRHFHTVFELTEWTPDLFNQLKQYVFGESGTA